MENKICKKCGYSWKAKKAEPIECPDCKSRYWSNSTMEVEKNEDNSNPKE